MTDKKKLSKAEMMEHIQKNCNDTYSLAVEFAAIFLKLYGELPKMGLSGAQADYAKSYAELLPDKI